MKRFLTLGFLAVLFSFAAAPQAGATFPGGVGLIAVSEQSTGNADIFTFYVDPATDAVSHRTQLTDHAADDYDPAWSPDGTRIAFVSERDGNPEIYVMNADGSDQTRITGNGFEDLDPAWSPDGSQLAIRRNLDGNNEIVLIDAADGGNPVNLTNDPASDFNPEFSPDGTAIAFQRFTSGSGVGFGNEVMLMNADGSGQTNLTENENTINDGEPTFSPDGSKVAFHSNRESSFRVYVMDLADRSVAQAADPGIFTNQEPAFSPDGTMIATRVGATNSNLAILRLADSSFTQVTPGGAQATPSWQADDLAPTPGFTAGPGESEIISTGAATFGFSSSEPGSTFECSTDGAEFAACASPHEITGLSDGPHTFSVRAIDLPGNVSEPVTRTFSVVTTGPVIEITATPAAISGSGTAEFTFSASEPLSAAECEWDDSGWEPCVSPMTRSGLSDGPHTFRVRGTDELGNVGDPVIHEWVVETIAPTVTITARPEHQTSEPNAWFSFTSDNPSASFECRLNPWPDSPWLPCVSGIGFENLPDGTHGFEVRAVGQGAGPGTAAQVIWRIDTVAPRLGLHDAPASPTTLTSATFRFEMNKDGFTFTCQLDDGAAEPCSSPVTFPALAAGDHSLLIRALDGDGEVVDSVHHGWKILADLPLATITSAPAGTVSSHSSAVRFRADQEEAVFECRTGEGAWSECSSPASVVTTTDGPVAFSVRAKLPGEEPGAASTLEWTVDATAPSVSLTGGPSGRVAAGDATFTFDSNDPTANLTCRVDDGSWEPCAGEYTVGGLADGAHVLRVMAVDAAGNTGTARRDWTVDRTGPETTIRSAPAARTANRSARFAFSASEAQSTFECRLDNAAWVSCASPWQANFVKLGSRRFAVRAIDDLGNVGAVTSHRWTVTPPKVKGLKPGLKTFRRVALDRHGIGRIATVTCPEGRCRVTAPKRINLRLKGRKFTPGIRSPRGFYRERSSEIMVTLSPGARKVIKRHGPARIKLRLKVESNNGKRVVRNVRVTLVAR